MLSSGIGAAAEIHVNQTSIQAAVNSANPQGDTIIVHPGTYNENLDLSRISNLILMSASGNPDDTKIVSNDTGKNVISATSRMNLVIKGFTISGATTDHSGIYLRSCNGCTIENNKFLDDAMGVYAVSSFNTTIRNNTAAKTSEVGTGRGINIEGCDLTNVSSNTVSDQRFGIYFSGSHRNTVSGNSVSNSVNDSIVMSSSNSSTLENNTVKSNARFGISLSGSSNDILRNNKVSNGVNGVYLVWSPKNTISGNTVNFGSQHDIMLDNSSDNSLTSNNVSSSPYGIAVRYSNKNIITGNTAYNNTLGLYVTLTSTKNTVSGNKANSNRGSGIGLFMAIDNLVENNEANSNTNQGITLDNSNNNKIFNNSVSQNARGIYVSSLSRRNILSGNIVNSNSGNSGFSADGILLENSSENNVTSNIANSNLRYGIYAVNSNNSYIENNTVQNNVRGISLLGSTNSTISKNIASDSTGSGLYLSLCNNSILLKNIVNNNAEGISLDSSEINVVSGNNISSNGNGIYMCPRSYGNRVYDNCFNNINNANIRNNRSSWNMEKTSGKNVMGGPTLGGNFWGSPSLMGFSDTNSDADGDGIIDIPFVSANGNVTDNYPLIRVVLPVANFNAKSTKGFVPLTVEFTDSSQDASSISWDVNGDGKSDSNNSTFVYVYQTPGIYNASLTASNKNGTDSKSVQITAELFKVQPVADFSANVTSGYAPLSVLLTDRSQNATSRSWDFNKDGIGDSNESSLVYVYTTPGTYTVSLTATNANGTSPAKTAQINVMQVIIPDDDDDGGSSHSSSGGSSGGGGGSPEPARNVQVKEISQAHVANGKPVKFDFSKNATCVVYVSFDAKKTAGKTTTIAEQLKTKSTLVSNLSSGEVYKYFNLWVGNSGFATEKNIGNPVVCFKIEKAWLQDKKIDQASITLNRYNDKKWSQLPAKMLKEDSKYLYFTAETPGFSFFGITGNAVEKESVVEAKPVTNTSELEQNITTVSETEQDENPDQKTGKESLTSIPGFEVIYVVACLITVFLHRRK
ncbi:NosD domain-containing protein [Methanosarcina sp.]|uniref:NosD domain-containing protein n=1 Tax=Methanosarcina sp. TaxID=2213 RepID=UPI003C754724